MIKKKIKVTPPSPLLKKQRGWKTTKEETE